MKDKFSAPLFDLVEAGDLIIKILTRNRFGLTADKIRKDLPPSRRVSKDQLVRHLDDLVSSGRIHAWHPPGANAQKPPHPIYSLEPLPPLIQREIQSLLKEQTLTPAQVKKSLPAPVNKYLLGFLDPLIMDRTVKWHPPLKGKRLSLEEPDPAIFLSTEIKRLFDKGEKLGFPMEAISQAVQRYGKPISAKIQSPMTLEEAERIIFKGMTALKPAAAQGALVYIPDLRRALGGVFTDKDSFDQAIMKLAKCEKIQLQSHSLPAELTEEQRQAMIDNGRGSYFMAIGIRME